MPISAASVVIMIGRKRIRQASRIASWDGAPARFFCNAKSIIMIAFFLTMPISISTPMMAMIDRSKPKSCSVASAPITAAGRPVRMVSGWMKLS